MRAITFSDVKVHNEIALCIVLNGEAKDEIERLFLKNRISYFEKWEKLSFWERLFGKEKEQCTLCVNEAQREKAEEIIRALDNLDSKASLVLKKVDKIYF